MFSMLNPPQGTMKLAAGVRCLPRGLLRRSIWLEWQYTLTDRGWLVPDRPKRSKKAARLPNKVVPIHDGAEPVRASLDDTDLAIVRALQANARAPSTGVGKAVGLSAASAQERVHRLETRGVIRGYHAEVDPELLGLSVLSLVSVLPSDSMNANA